MKTKLLLTIAVLFTCSTAFATTHVILFGGATGFVYSPDSLDVNVGDIIEWQGSFSSHPLESLTVPSGAAAFSSSTGTSFSYTITEAGTYTYHCSFHDFRGKLIAGVTTDLSPPVQIPEVRIFPTSTQQFVNIVLQNTEGGKVTAVLTNMIGQSAIPEINITDKMAKIDISELNKGYYFLCIRAEGILIRTERILKN